MGCVRDCIVFQSVQQGVGFQDGVDTQLRHGTVGGFARVFPCSATGFRDEPAE